MKKLILSVLALVFFKVVLFGAEDSGAVVAKPASGGWTDAKAECGVICPTWYMSGSVGMMLHSDTKYSGVSVDHETGVLGTAAIGCIIEKWRIELEGSYRRAANDSVTINNVIAKDRGHIKEVALLLNLLYDLPLDVCTCFPMTAYLGAGAGVVRSQLAIPGSQVGSTLFAWQLMTGVVFDLTSNWALTFGYRFFSTTKPTYNNHTVSTLPYSNNIDLGIRLSF